MGKTRDLFKKVSDTEGTFHEMTATEENNMEFPQIIKDRTTI